MSTTEDRLREALRAEHAAIFGYGVIGAHLPGDLVSLAVNAEAAHRARRDALILRLTGRGLPPPAAEPAYALPVAVTDQATALRLAALLEERVAAVWHTTLDETAGTDRRLALEALMDCAAHATRFRLSSGTSPATVPLPGAPA